MNKYFCDLQTKMVDKYKMGDRIQVNTIALIAVSIAIIRTKHKIPQLLNFKTFTPRFPAVLIAWQFQIVCADIRNQKEILAKADVIILHNVFECFVTENQLPELWKFFQNATLKNKGCKIISVPALQKSLANAKVFDLSQKMFQSAFQTRDTYIANHLLLIRSKLILIPGLRRYH